MTQTRTTPVPSSGVALNSETTPQEAAAAILLLFGPDRTAEVIGYLHLLKAQADSCTCPERSQGKHSLICEQGIKAAYGSLNNAPPEVRALLKNRS